MYPGANALARGARKIGKPVRPIGSVAACRPAPFRPNPGSRPSSPRDLGPCPNRPRTHHAADVTGGRCYRTIAGRASAMSRLCNVGLLHKTVLTGDLCERWSDGSTDASAHLRPGVAQSAPRRRTTVLEKFRFPGPPVARLCGRARPGYRPPGKFKRPCTSLPESLKGRFRTRAIGSPTPTVFATSGDYCLVAVKVPLAWPP
jgi:hypothetical protein